MPRPWKFKDVVNKTVEITVTAESRSLKVNRSDRKRPHHLTPHQSELLRVLLDHPGEVLTEAQLTELVWKQSAEVSSFDSHISHVRQALNGGKTGGFLKKGTRGFQLLNGPGDFIERPEVRINGRPDVPPKFSTWTLPLGTGYFTGRAKFLQELHRALQEHRTVLISAGGGCGKTQTAVQYTRDYSDQYEDVLWVRASDQITLLTSAREIAEALGNSSPSDADVHRILRSWFTEHSRALVVFDNLDNPSIAKSFWPTAGTQPFVLITSRNSDMSELGHFHQLKLKEWNSLEAVEFLEKRTGRENLDADERIAMESLAEETGCWPLALEQAAAFIRITESTFVEYFETYKRVRVAIFRRSDHKPRTGSYVDSVTITWKASVEQMPQAASELLSAASHLAFLNPFELFTCAPELLSDKLQKALGNRDVPEPLAALVGILQQYSLVHMDRKSNTFSIHKLLHELIRADQSTSQQSEWIARWTQVFERFLPTDQEYHQRDAYSRGWAAFEAFFVRIKEQNPEHPMIVNVARIASRYVSQLFMRGRLREADIVALPTLQILTRVLGANHPETLHALNLVTQLYTLQERYAEAEQFGKQAYEVSEQKLGSDHPNTLLTLNGIAQIYTKQRQYAEAKLLLWRAFEISEEALGSDHHSTLYALGSLALPYTDQMHYAEAEALLRRAFEVSERVKGSDHSATLFALGKLASLYISQGRYTEAEPLAKRAYEVNDRLLGSDHPRTLGTLSKLAAMYTKQGRYAEAEPLAKRAYAVAEAALDSDHLERLVVLRDLASLYIKQGRYAEAEPLLHRTYELSERVLGSGHTRTLTALGDLTLLYFSQGQYTEAEPFAKRAYEFSERVLGSDHPATLVALRILASLYSPQGRYAEAEPLVRRAYEIHERVKGSDHPETLGALGALALLYISQGRYTEAEPLAERAYEVSERALGCDHSETRSALNRLELLYISQERRAEAEALIHRACEVSKRLLGSDHLGALRALSKVAVSYTKQGRYAEAEPLAKRAYEASNRVNGPDHPATLSALSDLVQLYTKQGRYTEAEPIAKRVYEVRERVLGSDHPETLSVLGDLVELYISQGRYTEAEPLAKRAIEVSEQVLGSDHPETLSTLCNLAILHAYQGEYAKAKPLLVQTLEVAKRTLGADHPVAKSARNILRSLPSE